MRSLCTTESSPRSMELDQSLSSVQLLSCVRLFVTRWSAARHAPLSVTNSWSFLTHVHQVGDAIQPSHPLLFLPSIFSRIRVFSNESVLYIRWPKYWSFSRSVSPSTEYSGLISFRIYWFDLLAVQGTLKNFLQHHSLNASILGLSAFLWSSSHIHTWLLEKP